MRKIAKKGQVVSQSRNSLYADDDSDVVGKLNILKTNKESKDKDSVFKNLTRMKK